ncbi:MULTISPECIES: threonine aldolase family protein [Glutamicibacter]|uniref:Threonine aldolase n=1 Tax=Glutamicibacter arilaitensis TaxID=256701 RepID=A0A2N7S3F5_9MICC|nr:MULTISPECIES: low specificity L-threonine aldolase [Glutamicibacter]PMQ20643.1 threonine aldolase [Glutamicibacter arilaitensis]HCJ54813.1 low specificity L-threonine aldolase [Glutamicibacter sp.]HCM94353.1 low specificity L-threonine aldolase [Glutamicibacter sp.]
MTSPHDISVRGFASDNYSGVHPRVMDAIARANGGHQIAYGEDHYTEELGNVARNVFGPEAQIFPVFNGTGANVTALQSLLPRWGAVICASSAHINVDENGAPERVGGFKLLQVDTPDGKLTPELIDKEAWGWGDEHRAQPLAVSITQATELGTIYTPEEIKAITDHAHKLGMKVHLDGSRLSNAAASLNVPLRALTTDAGVDIVSLGGTKNGILLGEGILTLRSELAADLKYLRKMNMQLSSKMRFISAQLIELYGTELWRELASHSNAMAAKLSQAVGDIEGVELVYPTQANGVFAQLPTEISDQLREHFRFYDWDRAAGQVRWMCSFDTTEEDVEAFISKLRELCGAYATA